MVLVGGHGCLEGGQGPHVGGYCGVGGEVELKQDVQQPVVGLQLRGGVGGSDQGGDVGVQDGGGDGVGKVSEPSHHSCSDTVLPSQSVCLGAQDV